MVAATAAGTLTLGTLRPKLLVVFILLAILTTEEVVLVADVGAVEKVVLGWSVTVLSTLVCVWEAAEDSTDAAGRLFWCPDKVLFSCERELFERSLGCGKLDSDTADVC